MKATLVCIFVAVTLLASFCSGSKIIGYWGCSPGGHTSSVGQLKTAVGKGYNVIIYAFYDVDANGGLNQDPGAVPVPNKASIGSQFTYLVSLFGGQNGAAPTLTLSADAWAQNMYNNFVSLRAQYGFDGIDIDLENAWGGTGDQVVCGLRTFFKLMHTNGYIVSMAPQTTALTPEVPSYATGSWNSYAALIDTGIIDYVDILAVQLYNNAVPYNDAAQYASALIKGFQVSGCPNCPGSTGLVKVPACKIAFGWPSGNGAAPSGCPGLPGGCPYGSSLTSLYNGNSVLKGTGGVMTWAVEWDEYSNYQFISGATAIGFSDCTSNLPPPPGNSATSAASVTTASSSSSTTGQSSSGSSSSGSSGPVDCGSSNQMVCIAPGSSAAYKWCPSGPNGQCGSGTVCKQNGPSIVCDYP